MDKIAVGDGLPDGVIDLDETPAANLTNLASAKGCVVSELTALILARPRHDELIAKAREAGARVHLIGDGDVAGVISTTRLNPEVDIYMGIGGAPEGVLAAAALQAIGGQMMGRLLFRNDDERGRAERIGISDLERKYGMDDLAHGDVVFAATGLPPAPCSTACRARAAAPPPIPSSCAPRRVRCARSAPSIISRARTDA